jgi:uncharacterized protein (DUF2147 family)
MRLASIVMLLLFVCLTGYGQSGVMGKWKTIDDDTSEPKSVVEIFEKDGKLYGKIIKLFRKPGEDPDPICTECATDDPRFKKKITGMEILQNMEKSGDAYEEGSILDPSNGKIYGCKLWLEGNDLKIRGYWGPFYRTQTWLRVP